MHHQSTIQVFRLVSTGTIEELTYMRQIYKLQVMRFSRLLVSCFTLFFLCLVLFFSLLVRRKEGRKEGIGRDQTLVSLVFYRPPPHANTRPTPPCVYCSTRDARLCPIATRHEGVQYMCLCCVPCTLGTQHEHLPAFWAALVCPLYSSPPSRHH